VADTFLDLVTLAALGLLGVTLGMRNKTSVGCEDRELMNGGRRLRSVGMWTWQSCDYNLTFVCLLFSVFCSPAVSYYYSQNNFLDANVYL